MKKIILVNKGKIDNFHVLEEKLKNLKVNTYKNIDISFEYLKEIIEINELTDNSSVPRNVLEHQRLKRSTFSIFQISE